MKQSENFINNSFHRVLRLSVFLRLEWKKKKFVSKEMCLWRYVVTLNEMKLDYFTNSNIQIQDNACHLIFVLFISHWSNLI